MFLRSLVSEQNRSRRIILVFSQKSFRYYDSLQKTLFLSYSNMEKSAITSSLTVETCSWRNASGREACQ